MCGIAGVMAAAPMAFDPQALDAMRSALSHRGPDGSGAHRADGVGLTQTRLAIIDLETGDQPIREPDGAALVANGEIYNYVELRREIGPAAFATASDSETALKLYRRDGLAFAERMRGMYAVAIHDPATQRLVLARDPFGVKPLYYAETAAGFAFASEPQALIAAGLVAPRLRPAAGVELIQLKFTTGRATAFEGIQRVLPGETLVVSRGRVIERRQRPALPGAGPDSRSEDEAMGRLDAVLADSVSVHQRSDVPYGLFLSGGVDSSTVLAVMAGLNDRPVRTFTVGFPEGGAPDERDRAQQVAKSLGADHREVECYQRDFWAMLPRIAAAMDDPSADFATFPTYMLGAAAAAEGLKVVLTGEGGDEMFAGYGRYRGIKRTWRLGRRGMRWRGALQGFGVLRAESRAWRDGVAASERAEARDGRSRLQTRQAVDCADWLPNDLLIKLDRCLMAHGVEGRVPFLDPEVARLAFRLPDRLKVRGRTGKFLLRRWLARRAPEAEPFSRKLGFSVPVRAWIEPQGSRLGPLVARQPGVAQLCHPEAVERLFLASGKRAGQACWILLFFALWHDRHIVGRKPAGDVFHCLDAARRGG